MIFPSDLRHRFVVAIAIAGAASALTACDSGDPTDVVSVARPLR